MQKATKILILWVIIIYLSRIQTADCQHLYFKNYSLEQGLPQSTVLALLQDHKSNIWIGTQTGLSKFNGIRFKNYTTNEGLADNHVTCIYEDFKHRIWFGHRYQGLSILYKNRFIALETPEALKNNIINRIAEDKYGKIWISTTESGVFVLNETTDTSFQFVLFSEENKLSTNTITDIQILDNKTIWLGSNIGLIELFYDNDIKNTKVNRIYNTDNGASDFILSIAKKDEQTYWLSSSKGLIKANIKNNTVNFTSYPFTKEINLLYSDRIIIDSKNTVWGTSYSGLYSFDGKNYSIFDEDEGLSDLDINAIIEDREQNLWIGTMSEGLFQFLNDKFMFYNENTGLLDNQINSIIENQNGDIWIATEKGIGVFNGNTYTSITAPNILINNAVSVIFKDSRNNIWIGTYDDNPLIRYNPQTKEYRKYDENSGLKTDHILTINEDKNGDIWVASLGAGVSKYSYPKNGKNETFTEFTEKNGFFSNLIWIIQSDKDGNIWFGSDDAGICKYDGKKFTTYNKSNGLSNNSIGAISVDSENNIWLGSIGGGVIKFDGDIFSNYGLKHGLSSESPFSIICDDNDNVWVGTNSGIDKFDHKLGKFIHYGKEDGFLGLECNQNAVYKDKKGQLWFGTVRGVVKVNPEKFNINTIPPSLNLEEIKLYYETFNYEKYSDSLDGLNYLPRNLQLPYNKNHLTFVFAAISYISPEKIKYRYLLEGFDEQWNPETSSPTATYTNIPPGEYIFKFTACNSDGIWNDTPYEFKFKVNPPFWKTVWFYLFIAGFIGINFYLILHFRTRGLKRNKKILQQKINERTHEIQSQKEEIEAQRDELKSLNDELQIQKAQIIEQNEELRQQKEEILTQRDEIEKKSMILQRVNKIVEAKNKHITDSIKYAKRIQDAILPSEAMIKKYFPNSFVLFLPKDIVSGDLFWFENKGKQIFFSAIDCTGHGVPGAFMSIIAHNLINRALNEHNHTQPNEILNFISLQMDKTLHQKDDNSNLKAGLTISLFKYDSESRILNFASAQSSFFILRDSVISHYKGEQLPIGYLEGDTPKYTNREIQIKEGDLLYVFSDGYADQIGGEHKRKFLWKRLKNRISEIETLPLPKQKEFLYNQYIQWKGDNEQVDDILFIGIRF